MLLVRCGKCADGLLCWGTNKMHLNCEKQHGYFQCDDCILTRGNVINCQKTSASIRLKFCCTPTPNSEKMLVLACQWDWCWVGGSIRILHDRDRLWFQMEKENPHKTIVALVMRQPVSIILRVVEDNWDLAQTNC